MGFDGLWHCDLHPETFMPECLTCKWCLAQQDLCVNCVSFIFIVCDWLSVIFLVLSIPGSSSKGPTRC
jgi:hypothetical protein